jgi:hypothetical protein
LTENDIEKFKDWFTDYAQSFLSGNGWDDEPILLKRDHTFRVCENMCMLCESVGLPKQQMLIAETAALFHDVGRFCQYRTYRTFRDDLSTNHAYLGLRVLGRHRMLTPCNLEEKRKIAGAIAWHNALAVPANANGFRREIMLLLRDADKLDIWKVVTEYYHHKRTKRDAVIELDLPDTDTCSARALNSLAWGRMVSMQDVRVLNDFKLLQIGWVYDLTFPESFRAVRDRSFIEIIAETLPRTKKVHEAVNRARKHVIRNV